MGRFTMTDLDEFIEAEEIDGTFGNLVAWCAAGGVELRVLSDGLDYYLRRILIRYGLMGVESYSNALTFIDPRTDGSRRAAIAFPHSDAECTRCACCKRNLMLTAGGEQDILCYIGNGSSDRCPARYADIVFAKEELQSYCQQENVSYFAYTSFDDVTTRLAELASRSRLRPRRRAWENRRALFMRES
jgi:2-hydroxy-3-keto-5-methylthiopentenyl-1-phosphate phosphatase